MKRAGSIFAGQPPTKKPILAQFLPSQVLPSCWRTFLVKDFFKEKIDSRGDKNNKYNKAANDNDSSLEDLSEDDDV